MCAALINRPVSGQGFANLLPITGWRRGRWMYRELQLQHCESAGPHAHRILYGLWQSGHVVLSRCAGAFRNECIDSSCWFTRVSMCVCVFIVCMQQSMEQAVMATCLKRLEYEKESTCEAGHNIACVCVWEFGSLGGGFIHLRYLTRTGTILWRPSSV